MKYKSKTVCVGEYKLVYTVPDADMGNAQQGLISVYGTKDFLGKDVVSSCVFVGQWEQSSLFELCERLVDKFELGKDEGRKGLSAQDHCLKLEAQFNERDGFALKVRFMDQKPAFLTPNGAYSWKLIVPSVLELKRLLSGIYLLSKGSWEAPQEMYSPPSTSDALRADTFQLVPSLKSMWSVAEFAHTLESLKAAKDFYAGDESDAGRALYSLQAESLLRLEVQGKVVKCLGCDTRFFQGAGQGWLKRCKPCWSLSK